MYMRYLCFLPFILVLNSVGRYHGLRVPTKIGSKIITLVNNSDETVYLRLKPIYSHPQCQECTEQFDLQTAEDNCCSKQIKIEYKIDAHSQQTIVLDKQRSHVTEDDIEQIDYSRLGYGKIHTFDKRHAYIRLTDKATYVIKTDHRSIEVTTVKS